MRKQQPIRGSSQHLLRRRFNTSHEISCFICSRQCVRVYFRRLLEMRTRRCGRTSKLSDLPDRLSWIFFFGPQRRPVPQEDEQEDHREIVKLTRRTLRGLRFQQSYSAGWSGALKIHVAEAGLNAAVQLAERQLSFPEIVHEYRQYLEKIIVHYQRIIVAIDELDKLESDETAQKFVNGIKAVFGQPRVFYLVSISENALSGFERRGLPIRDTFDSSFDDMVRVDYLDLRASTRLISRRLYPFPSVPYIGFCQAMSGGLPRDLIRQCRRMFEYRRENETRNTFREMYRTVIAEDVRAKLKAIVSEIQRLSLESEARVLLHLVTMPPCDPTEMMHAAERIADEQKRLLNSKGKTNGGSEKDQKQGAISQRACTLHEELIAYLYLLATTWEVMAQAETEATLSTLQTIGAFDQLSRARQWMAIDYRSAVRILNDLRHKCNIAVPSFIGYRSD